MTATESEMLALGTRAPAFTLSDPFGKKHSLADDPANDDEERALLVMFICNHCPFVKHVRQELANIGRDFASRGVRIFAINSNDAESYPGDDPESMRREIDEWGYTFPYLIDESQSVAKAYRAACTPDFFVFDGNRSLVYRGQLDDSRPSNGIPVTGNDLRNALNDVIEGRPVSAKQTPSIGCNIKWKPGNEPEWFR